MAAIQRLGMSTDSSDRFLHSRRGFRFATCALIFLFAFGVRVLSWQDTRFEVGKVQTGVTAAYEHMGQLLRQGGALSFFRPSSPLADLNYLGHPPGYSILIAFVHSIFGDSGAGMQFVQITCDALAAVTIFLIVLELLPVSAALVAGLLAAFSPQFAWNSVLLLPDSVAVFPILLAVYFVLRGVRKPGLVPFVIAGALIGLSCWLRANAMLLTFFVAAAPLILLRRKRGPKYALAVIVGTILIVLPLTIRNAIVVHRFIPLSLGAGQTLLEGIAEYDVQRRFGIPETDMGIMRQEAEDSGRPDYYGTLFNPDGVERERARLARGFSVIRSHPLWFAGVMIRRASSMLRFERARLISTEPPVSHSLDDINGLPAIYTRTPSELLAGGAVLSPQANASAAGGQMLELNGDSSRYGAQFGSEPVTIRKNMDYVWVLPIKTERGRMKISIVDSSGKIYAASIVETREDKSAQDQPINQIQLAFVGAANGGVRILFSNEAPALPNPVVKIGPANLYELGPARFLWPRYPRLLVHGIQKLFLTAVMLPLAMVGLFLLISQGRWRPVVIFLIVPMYYLCVQSFVHTEYRYVLAVDYFLFGLVAVTIASLGHLVGGKLGFLHSRTRDNNR